MLNCYKFNRRSGEILGNHVAAPQTLWITKFKPHNNYCDAWTKYRKCINGGRIDKFDVKVHVVELRRPFNTCLKAFRKDFFLDYAEEDYLTKNDGISTMRQNGTNKPNPVHSLPKIMFPICDLQNLTVSITFKEEPSADELDMINIVLESWFLLGKLGAFNMSSFQIWDWTQSIWSKDSYLIKKRMENKLKHDYRQHLLSLESEDGSPASFEYSHAKHDVRQNFCFVDFRPLKKVDDVTSSFWINLGTSDERAVDMLLNCLLSLCEKEINVEKIEFSSE